MKFSRIYAEPLALYEKKFLIYQLYRRMILNAFLRLKDFPAPFSLSLSLSSPSLSLSSRFFFGYKNSGKVVDCYLLLFLKRAIQLTLWRNRYTGRMQNVLQMIYSFSSSKNGCRGRHGSKASGKRELFVIAITRPIVPRETRTRGKRAKQKYHLQSHTFFLWYSATIITYF